MNTMSFTNGPVKVPSILNVFTEHDIYQMTGDLFGLHKTLGEVWRESKDKWTESPDGTRSCVLDSGIKLVFKTVKRPRCTCCGQP